MERDELREAWDEVSETYASNRDPTGSDTDLIQDLLESLPPEPKVLDVGCGDGARTLANLPEESVGVDISRHGLELATEVVGRETLVQGDMTSLPFVEDGFDAVTAYHSVFHVPRDEHPHVYKQFRRVLRPKGRLLMTLPGGRYDTVRDGWMGGSMYFSTPGRERTLSQLRGSGFVDLRTQRVSDPLGTDAEFVLGRSDTSGTR
jgi:SAM-dependent methyltransferase